MKCNVLAAGCAAFLAASAGSLFAAVADHPYQAIIARNPFGLKPIPPPQAAPPPETPPAAPSRDIKLTGISTLLGPAKVFIEIIDPTTKKTERPSGMLVGEQQFEVEVLAVDVLNSTVKIRNRGQEATLDFVNNGIKPAAAAPGGAQPNPGGAPTPVHTAFRPPPPPAFGAPAATPVSAPAAAPTSRAVVAGGPGGTTPAAAPNPHSGIPPEVQARIEAYRRSLQAQQNGTPGAGIMPPGAAPVN
jgi:hypothetical protein